MDHSKTRDLIDLKTTIFDLITDLEQIFSREDERSDLTTVCFFFKRLHAERIMNHIISKLLPHKKYIENRDLKFFEENSCIFEGLHEDRIIHYKTAFVNTKRISHEDRDIIWQYLDVMIQLAESYSTK